ncbi:MAG: aminoacyl-tRNA deacylase [Isosphaeraceae bacterium]
MYTIDYLRSRRVWFEELLHSPASSSTKRAHSVHVPGCRVAKTVLIKAGDRFVLSVLPSTSRVELGRLSETLGLPATEVRLASTDELVGIFTDCEPGVVPPFGRLYDLDTVFDASLTHVAELVFGANTRHEGLRMRSEDYVAIEGPVIGSFAVPIAPRRIVPAVSQADRRAG